MRFRRSVAALVAAAHDAGELTVAVRDLEALAGFAEADFERQVVADVQAVLRRRTGLPLRSAVRIVAGNHDLPPERVRAWCRATWAGATPEPSTAEPRGRDAAESDPTLETP